jgi:NAD(P)-dependent dehydrogenase (short-subunit alcohol dehydrogenase family)
MPENHTNLNLGIGRATAISFVLEGCRQIAISDINLTGLHETEKYMKEVSTDVDVVVTQVDMQEEAQIENMVQAAVAKFSRVDYAVNCAGELPLPYRN